MILEEITEKLILLSEAKLSAEEWIHWFAQHKENVEKICGRRAFLGMKPKDSFSGTRNLYIGQLAAFDWLQSQKISPNLSDLYKKGWEKEFNDFCKAEKERERQLQKTVENQFGYLKNIYPRFLKQLTKSYSTSDHIEKGASQERIQNKEKELSIQFPEDLILFYQNISRLELEGLTIDFEELDTEIIQSKIYLVLGEFWIYGDGDPLLYHWESQKVYILAHGHQPPKPIKIANSVSDLVEKKLVSYLKEYEN
ncbi:SMI1/KNR4 family protein [Chryseobacterium sp. WG14]|uniref:SMI1/KNR4 family protein n=1 Tax=Chryseobacterium sp. WG14 TaxID=2926909 RepID=UPI00211F3872|nr:SMI1/KNR4 family protein [Chryseobacterium sp. WG14]MCQ9640111.1 SMI1/KNR4 family protein [Chryseobacterium sp. WG14]